jgi:hypothetical protein
MSKKIIVLTIAVCVVCLLVLSGCEHAAGGGGMSGGTTNTANAVLANIRSAVDDPVTDCISEILHSHNAIQYSGHYNNDGHGHHGLQADNVCAVADCVETGLHQHNGTHYAGHAGNDICGYHGGGHHNIQQS